MKYMPLPKTKLQRCLLLLIAADAVVFASVNPQRASSVWLIVGYVLLSLTILVAAQVLARGIASVRGTESRLSDRAIRYVSIVLVSLIGLQSVGQLTPKDVVTLCILAAVAHWYFGYNAKARNNS